MSTKTIKPAFNGWTVTAKDDRGKVTNVKLSKGDTEKWLKSWSNNPTLSKLEPGVVLDKHLDVYEKPNEYNGNVTIELWLDEPPRTGGNKGGGGVAKSDPAKNAIIEKANERNNSTIEAASRMKNATTCVELAVSTLGPGLGPNEYRMRAFEFYEMVKELASL
jgi:hypothetical protein